MRDRAAGPVTPDGMSSCWDAELSSPMVMPLPGLLGEGGGRGNTVHTPLQAIPAHLSWQDTPTQRELPGLLVLMVSGKVSHSSYPGQILCEFVFA